MPVELGLSENGYTLKLGGKESPPFPRLSFDYSVIKTPTGEETNDQLGTLLKSLETEGEDHNTLRKEILMKQLPTWRQTNPNIWVSKNENSYNMHMDYLKRTVKHDEITKQIVFLTGLSAFTPNPLNLFVRGPSSIGKTHVVMQSLKFFPKDSVWLLGGMSPTALVHDYGKMVDLNGNEIPENFDWKSDDAKYVKNIVDLSNKILVFLEAPSQETFIKLRPILSHDAPEIRFSFTDKTGKGTMRTRHVYLSGWPAMISCSVDTTFQEELATRSVNITPEMTKEKYEASILLQGQRSAEPWNYHNPDEQLRLYMENMDDLRRMMANFMVVLPYGEELALCYPHTQPRDMRDFNKLTSLIQQYTYFHLWQRPWLEGVNCDRKVVLATLKDFHGALKVFSYIAETTRSGIPGNVVSFFSDVLLPLKEELGSAISYDAVSQKNTEVYGLPKSKQTLKKTYLDPIRAVGWIDEEQDPEDKRSVLFKVIGGPEKTLNSFEESFLGLFNEDRLAKWTEDVKRNGGIILSDGVPVDWVEFPFRYFCEWSFNGKL